MTLPQFGNTLPGQPHPDVATMRHVLEEITPGAVLPYEEAARCIQVDYRSRVFRDRSSTARRQLEKEGVIISCVRGEGFMRELPTQTQARVSGREMKTLQRKARRNATQLASIDPSKIPEEDRPELYGLMTVTRVVQTVTSKRGKAKLTAACTAISSEVVTTKALQILQEREKDKD